MTTTLDAALHLAAHGVSVVKVAADGSKRPLGAWKEYQERRATEQEIRAWFGDGHPAVGLITGAVSGNLEMAEIEGRAAGEMAALQQLAHDNGMAGLWAKLCAGWLERSPSGGYHWFYRLEETPAKNTKLASRPATAEELAANPKERRKVLTETRGEGGFVVTAPSHGPTHETGRPWELVAGGPATAPTLTGEELEQFHFLLASLNVEPPAPPAPARTSPAPAAGGMFGAVSPLDDYEARTSWEEILLPAGWRHAFTDGAGVKYWTRPGKKWGISATTGKDPERDRLFVFTSATDFEPETPYTKQGAYAHLHHQGNHSAAATALRRGGYGKDAQIGVGSTTYTGPSPFSATTDPPPAGDNPAPDWVTAASTDPWPSQQEGNLATVTQLHPRPAATVAHTDDGNAARLIQEYGRELRFNPERGRWLHWTGNVWEWQPGNDGMARELAKQTIRAMETDTETDRAWKKKSLSAASISSMLTQAQTDARVVVFANQLDAAAWELNTPAGIIDLRTAELKPADPESLHTKVTGCAPDFDGTAEEFEAFLNTTFRSNQELIDYVQRLIGYSAVGVVREHILPMALGEGGNGKGVLFETTKAVLGEYAAVSPPNFLMKQAFQGHSTDLAMLHGARFVLNDEIDPEAKFDEAKVKQLAGGNSITARFMRQDNFTFEPTHQLWLSLNHQPGVGSGGEGFWRRVRTIPFDHTVPKPDRDPTLKGRLVAEAGPVILAWIARGAAAYYRQGLEEPEAVTRATADYAHNVDTVARFLEEECETGAAGLYTTINQFRNAYERYCGGNGDSPLKGRPLAQALERHGITTGAHVPRGLGGLRQYAGVRLNTALYFPADVQGPQDDEPIQEKMRW